MSFKRLMSGIRKSTRAIPMITVWPLLCAAADSELLDDSIKLLPPYSEIPPTFWEQYDTTALMAAVALIVVAGFAVWFTLRPKPSEEIPLDVQARRALTSLLHRTEDGQVLSSVSQILRRYIIAVFELPSGEPTTSEFCHVIAASENIGHELSANLADFLRACDERKFSVNTQAKPLGAAQRALELVKLAEARRSELKSTQPNSK